MQLNELSAISPADGRYRKQTALLAEFFSEYGLIRYRVMVEVEYFIALCEIPLPPLADFDKSLYPSLRAIYQNFTLADAEQIKHTEKVTNHDVKAVEYFLKEKLRALELSHLQEFVHFGLTSQDINNTAIPLSLRDAMQQVMLPQLKHLTETLDGLATDWSGIPMLAHTHGQPASPTRLGKEIAVFAYRLQRQLATLELIPFAAKFGGATGNLNAHVVTYPGIDWTAFANRFVNDQLGLSRSELTTQIENYDFLAAFADNLKRINNILIDMSRDIWTYISMGYFKQRINPNEVGSSAMPHKVNPIDFENAEGNLAYANAILEFMAQKLPISRLQRDLTDSTVLRNLGVPVAHSYIALQSLMKGLGKIEVNHQTIAADLEDNWAVVAEAIQSILRSVNYPSPYEALKNLTRTNQKMSQAVIHRFIDTLEIAPALKERLKEITPFNYTGV